MGAAQPARSTVTYTGAEIARRLNARLREGKKLERIYFFEINLGYRRTDHLLHPMLPFLKLASADSHCMLPGESEPPQASGTT
jgi:hypothetical protein